MFPIPQPIKKAVVVDMSEDVVLLRIDGVVPQWDMYTFSLDIQQPGKKHIVLSLKRDPIEKATVGTQTDAHNSYVCITSESAVQTEVDEAVPNIKPEEENSIKVELPDLPPKLEEPEISLADLNSPPASCLVSPCNILIRRASTVTRKDLPKYMIRPFDIDGGKRVNSNAQDEEPAAKRTRSA